MFVSPGKWSGAILNMKVSRLQKRADTKWADELGKILDRFPAWNPELYRDGVLEIEAGYAESGRAVATLIARAKSMGIELAKESGLRLIG